MKSINLIKPYIKENRVSIILGVLSLIAVDMLQLYIPRIIKRAIDDLAAYRAATAELFTYAIWIVGIAALMVFCRYGWRYWLMGMSRRVEEGLRNRLFSHIQTLSASYFNKTKTGDLMAHATNDIQHIRMAAGMGVVALTDGVVLGTAAIGFMAYINLSLTLFVLIPAPLIIFSTRFFSKRMHKKYQDVQSAFSDLTEVVRERFSGIRIVKAYNREQESISRLEAISRLCVEKNLKLVRFTGSFFPLMVLFSNLSLAIVLYLGGRQTIMQSITPGDFVAFISYLGLLTWPMMAIGWVTNLVQRGKASLDRINTILETPPEIDDELAVGSWLLAVGKKTTANSQQPTANSIHFKNVSFAYTPDAAPVLSEINFELAKGRTLGIVGPPGGGKTTLLNLIPRIYDVSTGCILMDSVDIRHIPLHELRSRIAFVPQEPFLFSGTIRENITFGDQEITESALIKAAEKAALYDTIQSFPNGFETVVGEKGVILSGGQKQRIALARALLKETPVLILDDPVSQVDTETGNIIIQTIRSQAGAWEREKEKAGAWEREKRPAGFPKPRRSDSDGNRIIIIVSHRLSALWFADQIITLKDGCIVESGTHAELMKQNNYYAKMFLLQELEESP